MLELYCTCNYSMGGILPTGVPWHTKIKRSKAASILAKFRRPKRVQTKPRMIGLDPEEFRKQELRSSDAKRHIFELSGNQQVPWLKIGYHWSVTYFTPLSTKDRCCEEPTACMEWRMMKENNKRWRTIRGDKNRDTGIAHKRITKPAMQGRLNKRWERFYQSFCVPVSSEMVLNHLGT